MFFMKSPWPSSFKPLTGYRPVKPEDAADYVTYLPDDQSCCITGALNRIDGSMHLVYESKITDLSFGIPVIRESHFNGFVLFIHDVQKKTFPVLGKVFSTRSSVYLQRIQSPFCFLCH